MKTIIASAKNGRYHEVHPNNMPPKPWGPDWPGVLRVILESLLASTGVLEDIRLSDDAILCVDLGEECTDQQRISFFEALLEALRQMDLHDPNQGLEYCDLQPGIGETDA